MGAPGDPREVKRKLPAIRRPTYIGNATGCSSIYSGNFPTTPYCQNDDGRGPAWSNSLFEDNAEFGLGMRLAVDKQHEYARELVGRLGRRRRRAGGSDSQRRSVHRAGIFAQRERVKLLREKLRARTRRRAI